MRVVTKSFEQASLPESLLIAMFPNGLVLDREGEDEQGEQVCPVDFDPACLKFVLDFYEKVQKQHAQVSEEAYIANVAVSGLSPMHCPLLTKPAVIVLREELDYFVLPQQQKGGQQQQQQQLITELKIKAGDYLKQQDLVFEALQRNIEKENNVAEQHLLGKKEKKRLLQCLRSFFQLTLYPRYAVRCRVLPRKSLGLSIAGTQTHVHYQSVSGAFKNDRSTRPNVYSSETDAFLEKTSGKEGWLKNLGMQQHSKLRHRGNAGGMDRTLNF